MNPAAVRKCVEAEGFRAAWSKYSARLRGRRKGIKLGGRGKPHPLFETIASIRSALLSLGFREVANPVIVDASEVYKQYGPEAPIILDRVFFLAGLPRPDIGLDSETAKRLRSSVPEIDLEELRILLRDYRAGRIESDDLVSEISRRLGLNTDGALRVVEVLKDFFSYRPEPSSLTLRSHMTAAWFITLSRAVLHEDPPIMLFSIGPVFRREQREDAGHLRVYHSASVVVADEGLGDGDAVDIAGQILKAVGVKEFRFEQREDTSRYYAEGTEYEVYAKGPGGWVEVATFGLYSPIALAAYGIPYEVFNMGIGVERLAALMQGASDLRAFVYPYLYLEPSLSDEELASSISYIDEPKTPWGRRLERTLLEAMLRHKDRVGPFKLKVLDHPSIYLYEPEAKRYLGPAATLGIYVKDGSITASPKPVEGGVYVTSVLEALVKRFASMIEKGYRGHICVKTIRRLSDANLKLSYRARRYIADNNRRIDVRGSVFADLIVGD